MANIKSQIKRNRQNEKRRLRNRVTRGNARAVVRKAKSAIEAGQAEEAKTSVMLAISALDKAERKGTLHRNNIARRKSRLMKHMAAMKPVEVKKVEEPVVEAAQPEPEAKARPTRKAPASRKKATAEKAEAAPKKATAAKKTATKAATKPATKATTKTTKAKKKAE